MRKLKLKLMEWECEILLQVTVLALGLQNFCFRTFKKARMRLKQLG